MKYVSLFIFPLFLILFVGCQDTCERVCHEDIQFIENEECLDEWGLDWEDLGYSDADDALEECLESWEDFREDADSEDIEDALDKCDDFLEDLRDFDDCNDYLEYFI